MRQTQWWWRGAWGGGHDGSLFVKPPDFKMVVWRVLDDSQRTVATIRAAPPCTATSPAATGSWIGTSKASPHTLQGPSKSSRAAAPRHLVLPSILEEFGGSARSGDVIFPLVEARSLDVVAKLAGQFDLITDKDDLGSSAFRFSLSDFSDVIGELFEEQPETPCVASVTPPPAAVPQPDPPPGLGGAAPPPSTVPPPATPSLRTDWPAGPPGTAPPSAAPTSAKQKREAYKRKREEEEAERRKEARCKEVRRERPPSEAVAPHCASQAVKRSPCAALPRSSSLLQEIARERPPFAGVLRDIAAEKAQKADKAGKAKKAETVGNAGRVGKAKKAEKVGEAEKVGKAGKVGKSSKAGCSSAVETRSVQLEPKTQPLQQGPPPLCGSPR